MTAIGAAFPAGDGWERTASVPFSSARKWSAASFDGRGTWVLGAPEMVWGDRGGEVAARADDLAAQGQRVLLLASTQASVNGDTLPADLRAVALVLFQEQVRSDAADTLAYFAQQGVALKVISGDNPRTVSAVARRVGLSRSGEPVDARELPEDLHTLGGVLEERSVFGRVTPQQKQLMVKALQSRGRVVAMTGDGVNDALALKLADVGVAMGSGAPATRAVAKLVLLDGRFATLPGVVAEGRRVIANIERVANLFVTKTVYATLLALAVGVVAWPYPFLPRHLTVVSSLTIGIPAFFLALAPNLRRYVPGFVNRVLRFALPTGFVAAIATFSAYWIARAQDAPLVEQRTTATLVLLAVGLWVLVILARPITPLRALLVGLMIAAFALGLAIHPAQDFFAFDLPEGSLLIEGFIVAVAAVLLLELGWQTSRHVGRGPAAAEVASHGQLTTSRDA
jgi:cation-transporting ATPase E